MAEHLWRNFVVSVWVLLTFCAYRFADNFLRWSDLSAAYGPLMGRIALAPLGIGILELMLWFLGPFRNRENGARVMAAFVGLWLLMMTVLVPLVWIGLYGLSLNWWYWTVYAYVSASHLAFAIAGTEH